MVGLSLDMDGPGHAPIGTGYVLVGPNRVLVDRDHYHRGPGLGMIDPGYVLVGQGLMVFGSGPVSSSLDGPGHKEIRLFFALFQKNHFSTQTSFRAEIFESENRIRISKYDLLSNIKISWMVNV